MESPMLAFMTSTWHCNGYRNISRCLAVTRIVSRSEENLLVRINHVCLVFVNADIMTGGGSVMLQAMAYGGSVGEELYDGVCLLSLSSSFTKTN